MRDLRTAARGDEPSALRDGDGAAAVSGQLAEYRPGEASAAEVRDRIERIADGGRSGATADVRPTMIVLEVLGSPAPKGSAQAFYNKRTQRAHVVPGGSAVTRDRMLSWGDAVRSRAMIVLGAPRVPVFVEVPLVVEIMFHVKRPKGHWGTGKHAGQLKPSAIAAMPIGPADVDKLARTTLDALTDAVFDDDSRIVSLRADKDYAMPGREGASITIRPWTATDELVQLRALRAAVMAVRAENHASIDDSLPMSREWLSVFRAAGCA